MSDRFAAGKCPSTSDGSLRTTGGALRESEGEADASLLILAALALALVLGGLDRVA